MQTQQPLQSVTIEAAADVVGQRFIGFDGDYCAADAKALGVSEMDTDDGELLPVNTYGIVIVESGGVISVGAPVVATTDGKALAATTLTATVPSTGTPVTSSSAQPAMTIAGSVLPQAINGYALDAATGAGEMIRIKLV